MCVHVHVCVSLFLGVLRLLRATASLLTTVLVLNLLQSTLLLRDGARVDTVTSAYQRYIKCFFLFYANDLKINKGFFSHLRIIRPIAHSPFINQANNQPIPRPTPETLRDNCYCA